MIKTIIIYLLCLQQAPVSTAYAISVDGKNLTQRRVSSSVVNLHYSHKGGEEVFRLIEDYGETSRSDLDTLDMTSFDKLLQIESTAHAEAARKPVVPGTILIVDRETLFSSLFLVVNKEGSRYLYRVQWYEIIE
ncbi:MAG: hypothetical protein WBB45_09250 [Cyclobacteriaceae bacterium]